MNLQQALRDEILENLTVEMREAVDRAVTKTLSGATARNNDTDPQTAILQRLQTAKTVKEVAAELNEPAQRVGTRIGVMVRQGVIRKVAGKKFQAKAA